MRTLIAVLGAAGLLVGCGETKKNFGEGFDTRFHESFVESCVKSATRAGADQRYSDAVCKCSSERIRERFSVREKMNLDNSKIMPIVEECRTVHR